MWDYNAELLNMKYLFRSPISPITNCYNNVFPCEFTGTYEAYGGDSTEEGHGGQRAPGTIYENCGDVNDRLTISNNHPNNRIVVPDGKIYLVDVLASAVFNLATNPSVADGRNTIFDRGKKILCPHILTALSSNRRCGQDTLY